VCMNVTLLSSSELFFISGKLSYIGGKAIKVLFILALLALILGDYLEASLLRLLKI
jgi:hypothetical protein